MIDQDNIPDELITRYLERHELPECEESYEIAARAGVRELFHAWLCYEGFLGYTDKILSVVDTLRRIDAPTELPVSKQTVLDWLGDLPFDQRHYDLFMLANDKRLNRIDWPLCYDSL